MNKIKNIKIRGKMLLFSAMATSLVIIVWVSSMISYNKTKIGSDLYNEIILSNNLTADILPPPEYIIEPYAVALEYMRTEDVKSQEELLDYFMKLKTTYEERYTYWKETIEDENLKKIFLTDAYQSATEFFDIFNNQVVPAVKAADEERKNQAQVNLKSAYQKHRSAIDETVILADQWQKEVTANSNQMTKQSTYLMIILAIVALGICIIVSFLLSYSMVSQIRYITMISEQISNGDLTIAINEKNMTRDEIGGIVKTITKLRDYLLNSIGSINKITSILGTTSDELELAAKQTTLTTEGIEKAVEEISQSALSQADHTEDASKQMEFMGNEIEETVNAVTNLQTDTLRMNVSSNEAMHTLEELDLINRKSKVSIDLVYQQTIETNEYVQKIKEATNIISSIANETNLLSLNAAIEAARSGESGRGFAVVAEQIKKLAEQSSESTKFIDEIIRILSQNSEKAVLTMKEIKQIIEKQNESLDLTKESFTTVYEGIGDSEKNVNQISIITKHLNDVRKIVMGIVNNLSKISEENAASTEETYSATAELAATMVHVENQAAVLKKFAADLSSYVNRFQI